MVNNQTKREKIFRLFSRNLEWVKEHKEVNFVPDFTNGYICPICFDTFFEEDLENTAVNPLTLEDVPPVSLGGKPLALTCKSCNSKNGHELDAHLLNILLDVDSKSFLPNSHSKATFEISGNKVNGSFGIDEKGTATLRIEPNISHPDHYKIFTSKMDERSITKYNPLFYPGKLIYEEWRTPKFKMDLKRVYKQRRAEIALLKIAYLIAFSNFGNGFLINPSLFKIREQILNPDKDILPNVFWIKHQFPKEMEGLNIVSHPKELHCFLIIFNLITKSKTTQCAIALPGPSQPSVKIYNYIEGYLCAGDGSKLFDFTVEHLAPTDYLKTKDYAFASHLFWQRYTHPDYKPKFASNNNEG
jgi:hypothetical protein